MEIRVKRECMTTRDIIIEFLVQNQAYLKASLSHMNDTRNRLLLEEHPSLREDIKSQYDARIKQKIAFYTAEALSIPVEPVIIELERIEVDDFLKV